MLFQLASPQMHSLYYGGFHVGVLTLRIAVVPTDPRRLSAPAIASSLFGENDVIVIVNFKMM